MSATTYWIIHTNIRQLINYDKMSISFSKNVPSNIQEQIRALWGANGSKLHEKYLNLLSLISKSRKLRYGRNFNVGKITLYPKTVKKCCWRPWHWQYPHIPWAVFFFQKTLYTCKGSSKSSWPTLTTFKRLGCCQTHGCLPSSNSSSCTQNSSSIGSTS